MKTIYIYTTLLALSLILVQCKDAPDWDKETHDSVPPGPVTNTSVENTNGGAVIRYTLPSDDDLLGVKALYSYYEEGDIFEAYSSAYTDSISLVGFPDTRERKVVLVALDKSRNESEPVTVVIQPLTPPVEIIRNSLSIRETFGGVYVSWDNPTRVDIGVSLYVEDENGFMDLDYTYYTKEAGGYAFRGYANEERNFKVIVKDRWNNTSESDEIRLLPMYEENIVFKNEAGILQWERMGYTNQDTFWRGDYTGQYSSCSFDKMFDGSTASGTGYYFNPGLPATWYLEVFTGDPEHAGVIPDGLHVTIDMKRETLLSRYKVYFRSGGLNPNDPYHLRIWASQEAPKQRSDFPDQRSSLQYWTEWPQIGGTGAWKEDWTLIGESIFDPPSGARETHEWTDEDKAWAHAGVDFDFYDEHNGTPFRYMRIECIENLQREHAVHFSEWEIYGAIP